MSMKFQPFIALLTFLFLQLPLHKFPQVLADLNSDRQALLDFAAAVPHARKLNWNATAPVCTSWVGVTCDLNRTRVIAIRLPGIGLSGPIPVNTIGKLDALGVLSLRSNNLSGNLPSDIPSIPSLRRLFLQYNNFSSVFPASLSPRLNALDFSYNSFTGIIPTTLQNLTRLAILNLQNNSISGVIPYLNLPSLKVLNFSYNNLTGSIPNSLKRFPSSSFIGNPFLCGSPLKLCSAVSSSPSPSPSSFPNPPTVSQSRHASSKNKLGAGSIIAIVIGGLAFLFLLLVVVVIHCLKRKDSGGSGMLKKKISGGGKSEKPNDFGSGVQEAEKNKLFFFEGCSYNFDLEDLLKASAEVLGKGSYGTTYKAALEEGTQVVVKRLKEVAVGKREFEQQMEVLDRVGRHPNVMPLRAYYYSKDEKLLVYSYMPAGSLFSLLHGNRSAGRTPLDWDSRMKIALGTARGIAHIHTEGGGKCTHGNIKSSNILLSDELEGCVSDVGLAPLMNAPVTMSRIMGYRAPEVIQTRKVTQKSDVYSFGVLLLEMLTAKAPLQPSGHDEVVDLPRWVRSVVREEWTAEVFDVELLRFQHFQEEMVQMLQIALACVAKTTETRPKMDEIVRMIEDIRQPESKNRTSSEAESNIQTP
ncbi:Protein kinase domain - like 10 [Theobroma cacao]|uniref:Leucine-rich repeat protein kinase family protein isoform 1 n=2 Tax=Theobroma cacao TaxID=3641 RepID=A0A061FTS3_THECC|nr:PREDICTED: probable inactive receptor kinase At5g58300 [Theobroma cacao]EOY20202.1 Leucine-rich repeat protein kinase family protein isoform 1 [Theobroma cacao]WRX12638.1 Protein kinase domain - like 10 [Theobroma cacao]